MSHQRADILLRLVDGTSKAITRRQARRLMARGIVTETSEGLQMRPDDYRVHAEARRPHGALELPHGPYRAPIDHNLLYYPGRDAFRPRPQFQKQEEA